MPFARPIFAPIARTARRAVERAAPSEGFTLIEALIAMVVLLVGIAAFVSLLSVSVHAEASSRAREGATNLARQILEDARTIPFDQLTPSDVVHELQLMPGLASGSESTWIIQRRGFTYTVTAKECSIDDPKDGYGKHDSTFCSFSNIEAEEDLTPIDLKQVTVDVEWTVRGLKHDVHQVETLTAAGRSIGLTANNLRLINPVVGAPTKPVVVSQPAAGELQFAFTTPTTAVAAVWSLEGARQSPQPVKKAGTTTEWVFSWQIPYPAVSDGTYLVSAQAIDSKGIEGPPVSISVTLIRGKPAAPKGLVAGFNTVYVSGTPKKVVDLQWQANTEKNVIGYRVYHVGGGSEPTRLACPESPSTLSLALSCIDFSPPKTTSPNLSYEVFALYREASGELLSEETGQGAGARVEVAGEPPTLVAPKTPTSLTAKKNADGSVTLTWPEVSGAAYYRVYRETTDYTGRYAFITSGTTTTFTDSDAVTRHKYWVTAVNSKLMESPFLVEPVEM
jgi:type II secretory pathway pseudopilin PulG